MYSDESLQCILYDRTVQICVIWETFKFMSLHPSVPVIPVIPLSTCLLLVYICVSVAWCSCRCWFRIQMSVWRSVRCWIWNPCESLVGNTSKWDLQTGNWKDDLQLSSCPNSHYRANTVPLRLWLSLSPVSISLRSLVYFSLILSLTLSVGAESRGNSTQSENSRGEESSNLIYPACWAVA